MKPGFQLNQKLSKLTKTVMPRFSLFKIYQYFNSLIISQYVIFFKKKFVLLF